MAKSQKWTMYNSLTNMDLEKVAKEEKTEISNTSLTSKTIQT